jgi:hypothetical protein
MGAEHISTTHGGTFCQEGAVGWPSDAVWLPGWSGTVVLASSQLPVSGRRAAVGHAGAPAAGKRPLGRQARTNELDAGKRRPTMGSEEEPSLLVVGLRGGFRRDGSFWMGPDLD